MKVLIKKIGIKKNFIFYFSFGSTQVHVKSESGTENLNTASFGT